MALLIDNDVTAGVLRMDQALTAMESAFRQYAQGMAAFQPRTDLWSPTAKNGDYYRWGSLLGAIADPPTLAFRFKSDILSWTDYAGATTEEWHCVEPGRYCGFIILVDTTNGEVIALMNDGIIQHVRVGATTGIGAKYLAREDASRLGILGSGGMARAYAEALCMVRPSISEIRVHSPTPANRQVFAQEMGEKLGVSVVPCEDPREALDGADIVATCTDSRNPVYFEEFLRLHAPGAFLVNVRPDEMDEATYGRVDRVVATDNAALNEYILGSKEDRDRRPLGPEYRRRYAASDRDTLPEIIAGEKPGRVRADEVIFYANQSAAIQFAAIGRLVYDAAKAQGLGHPIPAEWFLQDIRN